MVQKIKMATLAPVSDGETTALLRMRGAAVPPTSSVLAGGQTLAFWAFTERMRQYLSRNWTRSGVIHLGSTAIMYVFTRPGQCRVSPSLSGGAAEEESGTGAIFLYIIEGIIDW